jgi:hypothetical protein
MTIEFTTIILKTFEVDLPNNKNKKMNVQNNQNHSNFSVKQQKKMNNEQNFNLKTLVVQFTGFL